MGPKGIGDMQMRHLPVVPIYGYTNLVYNYNTWNSKEGKKSIQQSFMFSPKKLYFSNQWRSVTENSIPEQ